MYVSSSRFLMKKTATIKRFHFFFFFFVIFISSLDFVLRVFGYSNSGPVTFDGSQGTFFFFGSWVCANLCIVYGFFAFEQNRRRCCSLWVLIQRVAPFFLFLAPSSILARTKRVSRCIDDLLLFDSVSWRSL